MCSQRKAGVILSYVSEIIRILSALLYTPIMLRLLGQSEYGLYQLIHSVVAYLGVLSLGFTASYVRFYSRFKVNEKHDEIARLNGMFMTIFLVIALIALVCGSLMTLNIRRIFSDGLTEAEYSTAKVLMVLLIINLALTFPNSVFSCIISAHERFFFHRLLGVLNNLLNPFLSLPLLILGYGSIGVVVVTTIITIGQLSANIWYVSFKMKEKFVFRNFDFSLLKEIWGFTFFIFLNQIIDQINWSVDRFLLGRMINTTAVAVYGLGGQINSMYLMLSSSISSVFVPKVNKIVAESDDNRQLSLLFNSIGRIQFMVLSLVLTGFVFFGQPFMRFWGGSGYEDSYYVALWLIIPVTVPLIQNLGIEIQRAKNKHQTRAVVYFLIAIGNIFLSIPLIKSYGPIGAAVGTTIALFVGNILFMNWYYHKKIGLDIQLFWRNIFSFIPAMFFPILVGSCIMQFVPISRFVHLIFGVMVYTGVFCCSVWFLGMNQSEKAIVSSMLRKRKNERT